MSDVRRCDTCGAVSDELMRGWWRLLNEAVIVRAGEMTDPSDFCSWECLGAFVMDKAGTVQALRADLTAE